MGDYKTPSEIDRANRMFAVEKVLAAKLPAEADLIGTMRDIHEFISEAGQIETTPVGFQVEETQEVQQ